MNDFKLFICVQCGFEYDEEKGWPEDVIMSNLRSVCDSHTTAVTAQRLATNAVAADRRM